MERTRAENMQILRRRYAQIRADYVRERNAARPAGARPRATLDSFDWMVKTHIFASFGYTNAEPETFVKVAREYLEHFRNERDRRD